MTGRAQEAGEGAKRPSLPNPDLAGIRELVRTAVSENWAVRDSDFHACARCGGSGHHHGFGDDGYDPDWCIECGGAGQYCEWTEELGEQRVTDAIAAALLTALSAAQARAEEMEKVLALCLPILETEIDNMLGSFTVGGKGTVEDITDRHAYRDTKAMIEAATATRTALRNGGGA